MDLKDRIAQLIKYKGDTPTSFASAIGVKTKQAIYELLKGNTKSLSQQMMQKIMAYIPNLNIDWLLTGEGEMLASDDAAARTDTPDRKDTHLVPLIPIFAQAGSLSCFAESAMLRDCEYIVSPIKGAEYAVRVAGESMSPEFPNGSQVLIKKINPGIFIDWGKVYILDTQNGSVMKVLAPGSSPDRVKCISKNPDPVYAPFEVLWEDVIGVYRVLLCMSVK